MITVGGATAAQRRMHAVTERCLLRAIDAANREDDPDGVWRAASDGVPDVSPVMGHGLGLDIIEPPLVAASERRPARSLRHGMALALHPFVGADASGAMGYLADGCIVGHGGLMSGVPTDLVEL